jgi:hypothetical protein
MSCEINVREKCVYMCSCNQLSLFRTELISITMSKSEQ